MHRSGRGQESFPQTDQRRLSQGETSQQPLRRQRRIAEGTYRNVRLDHRPFNRPYAFRRRNPADRKPGIRPETPCRRIHRHCKHNGVWIQSIHFRLEPVSRSRLCSSRCLHQGGRSRRAIRQNAFLISGILRENDPRPSQLGQAACSASGKHQDAGGTRSSVNRRQGLDERNLRTYQCTADSRGIRHYNRKCRQGDFPGTQMGRQLSLSC